MKIRRAEKCGMWIELRPATKTSRWHLYGENIPAGINGIYSEGFDGLLAQQIATAEFDRAKKELNLIEK